MPCEWGHQDCSNEGTEKCDTCFSDSFHYKQAVIKKRYTLAKHSRKQDKRQGSDFEEKTRQVVSDAMSDKAVVQLTINSGATVHEKGDVQIEGLVTCMIEDKTQTVVHKAKGEKTFTIQRGWLTKLLKESREKLKEFHWLLFSFYQHDTDIYAITEAAEILSMIKTMESDRRQYKIEQKKAEVAQRRKEVVEAENIRLHAEIDALKAELELMKM
jgi:hypothetical protein